ncbi:hypothetical protein I4U23_008028 [Adineta vaga]|nr:hypothetical protein I4U23_008028 [Adineta vaga]
MLAGHIHLKKNIIDRACLTYKRCHEKNFLRGRSQELIVAACVYTACRQEDIPRTIKDICAFSMLPVPDVNKIYLNIKKLLPHSAAPKPMTIGNLVPGFCNQLGLDQNFLLRKTAVHIANCANELGNVQGRAPRSIAAAAIYMACSALDIKKSKKEIQEQLNVSESVIRNVYKLMLPNATQLFPKDFVSQRSIASLPRA